VAAIDWGLTRSAVARSLSDIGSPRISRLRTEVCVGVSSWRWTAVTRGVEKPLASPPPQEREDLMAIDTLIALVGVYDDVADAEADYELVKELHTEAGLIDAYDAAVVERREGGKTKIVKKHETPTRVGGVLGGGMGLATGLVVALFPFAAVGGGLLAATTGGGAILGAVAGHAAAGMSRHDLKELGEHLDAGQAGLVVVAVADMGAKVERAMKKAEKIEQKQIKADAEAIERDATEAAG
jgi:uncharacterized membrane protein